MDILLSIIGSAVLAALHCMAFSLNSVSGMPSSLSA